MSLTAFPYGVSSFGIPLIGSSNILTTGKVWFVHSGTGTDANGRGTDPSRPFATIDYAVGKCTASKGDTIVCMPGHSETLVAAGGVTVDQAGVQIVGLGTGTLRPTIAFSTDAAATFLVSAANVKISGLYFKNIAIDSLVTMISVTGANCTIENNEFLMGDANEQALVAITTTANDLHVVNNRFYSPNAGPASGVYTATAVTGLTVTDNFFYGNFSSACIFNDTAACLVNLFLRNIMHVVSATGIGISVHANATGVAAFNSTFVTANVAAGGSITMAAGSLFQNYGLENAHVGTSATLDPTAGGWG